MIGYLTQDHALISAFQSKSAARSRKQDILGRRIFKMAPKISDYFRDGEILAHKGNLEAGDIDYGAP